MAVSIAAKFNKADIRKVLEEKRKNFEEALLMRLRRIGEQFVSNARQRADFTDRTGNLRSSMGYVILKDGNQLYDNFQQKSGGTVGVDKAKEVIDEIKKNFPTGYVLIGVAGMDYAAAVESKGFDVITSSAGIAELSLKDAVKKLSSKLK